VEVLVVISLLSLIVLALMQVFSVTQQAFRASVTQQDVLEGSRATMDMLTADLRQLVPSDNASNGAVNFSVVANAYDYAPLVQNLPGSSVPRQNLLNYFFVLGRNNTTWSGTGYIVNTATNNPLYPLYRFYAQTNIENSPVTLFNAFSDTVKFGQWTNMSHVMDGVVHLVVRAYDTNGVWINNYYRPCTNVQNTLFFSTPQSYGEAQFYMYSNAVPAAVELQLGVLEDRALARAESLPFQSAPQWNYLTNQSGAVHLFRQRVTIQNVDPSAYQ
jgi:type II secretory pathway pseudopilin PulG